MSVQTLYSISVRREFHSGGAQKLKAWSSFQSNPSGWFWCEVVSQNTFFLNLLLDCFQKPEGSEVV